MFYLATAADIVLAAATVVLLAVVLNRQERTVPDG